MADDSSSSGEGSVASLVAVITSTGITALVALVLWTCTRSKFPECYESNTVRKENPVDKAVVKVGEGESAEEKRFLFTAFKATLATPLDDMVETHGLDAVMLLKVLKTCLIMIAIIGAYGLVVLLPLNATSGFGGVVELTALSLASVPPSSVKLWGAAVGIWLVVFVVVSGLDNVGEYWQKKRFDLLTRKTRVSNYQVLVRNIPSNFRTPSAVHGELARCFGSATSESKCNPDSKVSMLPCSEHPSKQPTMDSSSSDDDGVEDVPDAIRAANRMSIQGLPSASASDSSISGVAGVGACVDETAPIGNGLARGVIGANMIVQDDRVDALKAAAISTLAAKEHSAAVYAETKEHTMIKVTSAQAGFFQRAQELWGVVSAEDGLEGGAVAPSGVGPGSMVGEGDKTPLRVPSTPADGLSNNTSPESWLEWDSWVIPSPLGFIGRLAAKANGVEVQELAYLTMLHTVTLESLKESISRAPEFVTGGAIVHFNSVADAAAASQANLHPNDQWISEPAPDRESIVWANLNIPEESRGTRMVVSLVLISVVVIFFAIPAGIVQGMSSIDALREYSFLDPLADALEANATLGGIVLGLLPVILLAILLAIAYTIFQKLAFYRAFSSLGMTRENLFSSYYSFIIGNVFYLGIVASSLATTAATIAENPSSILDVLSVAVPASANTQVNYVLLRGLGGFPMMLFNPAAVVLGLFFKKRSKTDREEHAATQWAPLDYASTWANCLLIFQLSICYAMIAPIMALSGIVFFGLGFFVYKHNVIYGHSKKWEGFSEEFPTVFSSIATALYTAIIFLAAVMLAKKGPQGIVVLCALPVAYGRVQQLRSRFMNPAVPVGLASRQDEPPADPKWAMASLNPSFDLEGIEYDGPTYKAVAVEKEEM